MTSIKQPVTGINQVPESDPCGHRQTQVPSLLIVGQTPPPLHGQAVATKMLFDYDWGRREIKTLRVAYSDVMHSVGRFELKRIQHLFELIRTTRRILETNPDTILFYSPASAHWIPFLRGVIYLWQVRKS